MKTVYVLVDEDEEQTRNLRAAMLRQAQTEERKFVLMWIFIFLLGIGITVLWFAR